MKHQPKKQHWTLARLAKRLPDLVRECQEEVRPVEVYVADRRTGEMLITITWGRYDQIEDPIVYGSWPGLKVRS